MAAGTDIDLTPEERQAIQRLADLAATGNYYVLLGVSRLADTGHIRRAFYDISRTWHPDRFYRRSLGSYREILESVFVTVTKAYSVLSDPKERAEYDQENAELLDRTASAGIAPMVQPEEKESPEEDPALYEVARRWEKTATAPAEKAIPQPHVKPPSSLMKARKLPVPGVDKVREQIKSQVGKAKEHYEQALAAAAEGNWIKAQSSIYLAMRFIPTNQAFKKLYDEYTPKARLQQAQQAIQAAESAEGYHNVKGAISHYERACSFDPPVGLPFFRLAVLKRSEEEVDKNEILRLLRLAVEKEGHNTKFRMALAEHYLAQGNKAAAKREFQSILRVHPNHPEAKAGLKKT